MDVGSKEVLMESPPVSLIVCVHMCAGVYLCVVGPTSSNLWACFLIRIHSLN